MRDSPQQPDRPYGRERFRQVQSGFRHQSGTIHDRRLAVARLHQEDAAKILFKEIAPVFKERKGGYTRIIRLNQRQGDAAQRAILEWVEIPAQEAPEPVKKAADDKTAEAAK